MNVGIIIFALVAIIRAFVVSPLAGDQAAALRYKLVVDRAGRHRYEVELKVKKILMLLSCNICRFKAFF